MKRCYYCRAEVDPQSSQTVQRMGGWERRAAGGSRRGGSDILLRERRELFAHLRCVELQKQGIPVGQGGLGL